MSLQKQIQSKVISDSVVYGLTSYLSVFVSIFLTPIYTRILTKEEYGILDVFNVWNNFALMILPIGLFNAIIRFYPEFKDNPQEKKESLGTIFTVLLIISLIYCGIMISIQTPFLKVFFNREGLSGIYFMSMFIVAGNLIISYHKTLLRIEFKKWAFFAVSVIQFIVLSLLGFVLVYSYHYSVEGFFIASLIAMIIALMVSFYFNRKETHLYYNPRKMMSLTKYAIHFLSVSLLLKFTDIIDRYLLKEYMSLSTVGIYSLGFRISSIFNFFLGAISMAWIPYAMSMKDHPEAKYIFRKVFELYLLSGFIIVTLIMIFRDELIRFFAPDYGEAFNIIGILIAYNFLMGFAYFITLGIQIKKVTKYFSFVAILSVITNVIVSIALVHELGSLGIALGTLAGGLVWIGILHFISQKYFYVRISYLMIIILSLFIALFFGAGYYLHEHPLDHSIKILLKISLSIVILGVIFFMIYKKNGHKGLAKEK